MKEVLELIKKLSITKVDFHQYAMAIFEDNSFNISLMNMMDDTHIDLGEIAKNLPESLDGVEYIKKSYFIKNKLEMFHNIIDLISECCNYESCFEKILRKFFIVTRKLIESIIETNYSLRLSDRAKHLFFLYLVSNGYYDLMDNLPLPVERPVDYIECSIELVNDYFWKLPEEKMSYLLKSITTIINIDGNESGCFEDVIEVLKKHKDNKKKLEKIIWLFCSEEVICNLLKIRMINTLSIGDITYYTVNTNDNLEISLKLIRIHMNTKSTRKDLVTNLPLSIMMDVMTGINEYYHMDANLYNRYVECLKYIIDSMTQDEFNSLDIRSITSNLIDICSNKYYSAIKSEDSILSLLRVFKIKLNKNENYKFHINKLDEEYQKYLFIKLCQSGIKNVRVLNHESIEDTMKYLLYDIGDIDLVKVFSKYIMQVQ